MSDQETIDRLTRELSDKHESLMLFLEGLNGQQALTAFLMERLEQVMMACGIGEGDAESHVQGIVKRWQDHHGYGKTAVEWTTVRPTKPGTYWRLNNDNGTPPWMVYVNGEGNQWSRKFEVTSNPPLDLWWPIPIEPPPLPT